MSMHSPVQTTKVCSKRIVKLRRILLHELHAHALRQVQRTGQTSPLGEKYRYYRANRGTDVGLFVRNWVVCDTVVGRIVVPSSSFKRKVLRSTETSGKPRQTAQCLDPEDTELQEHRCEDLKGRKVKQTGCWSQSCSFVILLGQSRQRHSGT